MLTMSMLTMVFSMSGTEFSIDLKLRDKNGCCSEEIDLKTLHEM